MFELLSHPDCPDYQAIPCPACRNNAVVLNANPSRGFGGDDNVLYGEAICLYCKVGYNHDTFTFSYQYNKENGEVNTSGNDRRGSSSYKHFPQKAGSPETSKVFIATKGQGDDFRVCGVYTRRSVQDSMAGFEFKEYTIAQQHQASFMVYIVAKDNSIDSVHTEKAFAAAIAKLVGGRIHAFKARPAEPTWYNDYNYLYYVVLRDESRPNETMRVRYVDSRSRNVKQVPGENDKFTVTRRRPYRNEIPYRLEVSGRVKEKVNELAEWISCLTLDEIEDTFEYNVDFAYQQTADGEWEREPCQEIIHDEETVH